MWQPLNCLIAKTKSLIGRINAPSLNCKRKKITKHIKPYTMKNLKTLTKATLTFALFMFFAPSTFAQMEITDDGVKDKISVSVFPNPTEGKALLKWEETSIEYVEIVSSNGQFIPEIPVLDAKTLHLNDLKAGVYTINFKSKDEVLLTKKLLVANK